MTTENNTKFYVGQPVWLINKYKVEGYYIGAVEKVITVITTKEPGPDTKYRLAGDGSGLFTSEVKAINARQDLLRVALKEIKELLEQGVIDRCTAERKEDAEKAAKEAERKLKKSAPDDSGPSI
jgi:hypothetical protein